ncbi:MAG TPA: hypothetical protein VFA97_01145 [Gaiellaceae bacterium]|nr:hypothetical protein [Gaiellaceae bacterium]
MDAQTIDQEYEKLQTEFQDVATSVQTLAEKLQTAAQGGDANATAWLADLKQIALDISDEQIQANTLLTAIHGFITSAASGADAEGKEPLFAPGHEPEQQAPPPRAGGLFGGGMFGGPMMGGYMGGGFARAMEMGAGVGLGQTLVNSIFHL